MGIGFMAVFMPPDADWSSAPPMKMMGGYESLLQARAQVTDLVCSVSRKTEAPTALPTLPPSKYPTPSPTMEPTLDPTRTPTHTPTDEPTVSPTHVPTELPTCNPTPVPTEFPTEFPTLLPTKEPSPCRAARLHLIFRDESAPNGRRHGDKDPQRPVRPAAGLPDQEDVDGRGFRLRSSCCMEHSSLQRFGPGGVHLGSQGDFWRKAGACPGSHCGLSCGRTRRCRQPRDHVSDCCHSGHSSSSRSQEGVHFYTTCQALFQAATQVCCGLERVCVEDLEHQEVLAYPSLLCPWWRCQVRHLRWALIQ